MTADKEKPKTPLERMAEHIVDQMAKQAATQKELEGYGHKDASGGTAWNGQDLARYFEDKRLQKKLRRARNRGRF